MVGDGVNDVPALKASRLSVAQGSGTQMAKAVADIVLVDGDFASIPGMVAEGRRILRNIQRVTKLFVTKSVFAAFVIVAIGITPAEYPLLPRHLTIVGALTVGIPAFFLALAPSDGPWRTDGFLREVARFAVPAGVAAGLGVTTTYLIAVNVFDLGLLQSRTAATSTLVVIGLYLVLALEATSTRRARLVGMLCAGLLLVYLRRPRAAGHARASSSSPCPMRRRRAHRSSGRRSRSASSGSRTTASSRCAAGRPDRSRLR